MFYRHERLLSPKLSCIFHRELGQWVPVVSFAKQFTSIVLWFVYYDSKYLRFCVGFYQCGPASVNAIKNGEVYLNYDTGFIFAEVNADKVYWEVPFLFSGEIRAIQTDKMVIGKNISTLKPGTNGERQDITRRYKHPEGILSNMQGWP